MSIALGSSLGGLRGFLGVPRVHGASVSARSWVRVVGGVRIRCVMSVAGEASGRGQCAWAVSGAAEGFLGVPRVHGASVSARSWVRVVGGVRIRCVMSVAG
ncbi:hypothetical protein ACIBO9_15015, partial [Streptomyces prunicolor]|uniref:hypothetical protein n=1 Tax=Streptomyces prunicolor TaxID=67348 RepID=UPI0037D10EEA